jgi:AcrR family transcriptional regulator
MTMPNKALKNSYHHGDLRQSMIDAACAHLSNSSADSLSLRALARELGVSPTAPYRHFESKNALFAAIACSGFEQMTESLSSVREKYRDDMEASMLETSDAYVSWALANPEKYQMFFDTSLVDFNEYPEIQERSKECFDVLISLIEQGLAEGVFIELPSYQLAMSIWAGIHGTCSLLLARVEKQQFRNEVMDKALAHLSEDRRTQLSLLWNSIRKH